MPIAVAIPARDEAERISDCLRALDAQDGARIDHVVVLVNNSTDATAELVRTFQARSGTTVHALERQLPPHLAHAGQARRLAMDAALALAGPDGILATTDADGMVDPDWLAANLRAMRAGADVVAGWVDLHPADWAQIPAALHADDARECAYDLLCDEIHGVLDPDPADPLPRHTQHSGASIAVTAAAYRRSGGVPVIPSGEDRALIAALRRVDARIRHAPEVHVAVSGRIHGRSVGGMADTIRRRIAQPDRFLDDRLEPATDCVRRARFRAELRRVYNTRPCDVSALRHRLDISEQALAAALRSAHFGQAWEAVETGSPVLRRQLVSMHDLPVQMQVAEAIVAALRLNKAGFSDPAGRSDSRSLEAEDSD